MNKMAKTSVANGKKAEKQIAHGLGVVINTMPVCVGYDGKKIIPDIVTDSSVIEVKYNGKKKGTMHEKWPCAVLKIKCAAEAVGKKPVLIIIDDSADLFLFVKHYVLPIAVMSRVSISYNDITLTEF